MMGMLNLNLKSEKKIGRLGLKKEIASSTAMKTFVGVREMTARNALSYRLHF